MERYYFLFFMAFVWIVFACIQDLRKREVANWLNFSLMAFALAYRAFYSAISNDWNFLILGLLGFAIFIALANLFYYAKIFAGGDAKLFMALGAILPFESYQDLLYISLTFVVLLFLVGAIYSLIYSLFLVYRNWQKFKKEFANYIRRRKIWFGISLSIGLLLSLLINLWNLKIIIFIFFALIPFIYFYLRALEDSCMIKSVPAAKLTEGDWLEKDVKVGQKWIRKSVHGLSLDEIRILQRANKKVVIKEGVPFVPAFLIAFLIMVYAFSVLSLNLANLASLL